MGGFLAQEPFFGFGLLFVVIIAFGCGIEIDVAARRHADIALRRYLRGFGGDIAPGEDLGIRPAGDLGSLLAYRFVDDGFLA